MYSSRAIHSHREADSKASSLLMFLSKGNRFRAKPSQEVVHLRVLPVANDTEVSTF